MLTILSETSLFQPGDSSDTDRRETLNGNIRSAMELEINGDESSEISLKEEAYISLRLVGNNKLNWLLICGPIALIGSSSGILGEASCFCLSGMALIPCAERLSFVTEQLAEHTNETIGALLNATFGNAPEFLISSAALRSGYYRVVQLTLLGSVLTNLLFVFGLSCLVGGLQWQVQQLRITSGNATIGMLLTATMGLVLPAALKIGNQNLAEDGGDDQVETTDLNNLLSENDVAFSRFNSLVMTVGYISYLIFQLGSHKDEFDYNGDEYAVFGGGQNKVQDQSKSKKSPTRQNLFCKRYCFFTNYCARISKDESYNIVRYGSDMTDCEPNIGVEGNISIDDEEGFMMETQTPQSLVQTQRKIDVRSSPESPQSLVQSPPREETYSTFGSFSADDELFQERDYQCTLESDCYGVSYDDESISEPDTLISLRMGLVWLATITIIIANMSDILIQTIDGFAARSKISEVFTSVIIIPYFSNIAEQVSAVIFAYRNKMDLCIGVTCGSAIQIAQFVMPGCVIVGWFMDRPMTLYYQGYETACLLLGVLCVAAVLQGGTTNWLVGIFFVGVYLMIAAGFWYHEEENLAE